jgi:hypothetical protein
MALTYTTLKAAIQTYLKDSDTEFVADLDVIIKQAEDRILKSVQLPDFRKNSTGNMTTGSVYLSMPTDFLAAYSLAVINGSSYEYLLQKDVNFIRQAFPNASATGTPRFYSIFDDDTFIIGPTPDADYTAELHYFYRPASIVDAGSSWLGENAEHALLYACLTEAYGYLKGEPDLVQLYEAKYKEAMQGLQTLGEGYNTTDSYRAGAVRTMR